MNSSFHGWLSVMSPLLMYFRIICGLLIEACTVYSLILATVVILLLDTLDKFNVSICIHMSLSKYVQNIAFTVRVPLQLRMHMPLDNSRFIRLLP